MGLALSGAIDPVLVVRFAASMLNFWLLRGQASEGRGILRAALALPAVRASDVAHAWALYIGAALAGSQSEHAKACEMLQTCLALRRRLGNPLDIAATLSTLALSRLHAGDAAGAGENEAEALRLFRELGDRFGEAIGLLHLGQIAAAIGDDAQARSHLAQGLALARAIGNAEVEAECELVLGALALDGGDAAGARPCLDRSLAICREASDARGEANALWWLGRADLAVGSLDPARERLGKALRAFRDFEMWDELLGCLDDHARLARAGGQPEQALRLASAAECARQRLNLPPPLRHGQAMDRWRDELRASLPDDRRETCWAEGQAWDIDAALRHAG